MINVNKRSEIISISRFHILSFLLLTFCWSGCVEHLITVRVYPDGSYEMHFQSEGDSTDIFDQDFPHPGVDQVWSSIQYSKPGDDQEVWVKKTSGLLSGVTVFTSDDLSPAPLRHPISVEKKEGWISTSYRVTQIFKGREVYRKYPRFGDTITEDTDTDSIQWLPEAMTYVCSRALEDMQSDTTHNPAPQLLERITNHLRSYFRHLESKELIKEIESDRVILMNKALKPFLGQLPNTFMDRLLNAMEPYERELSITAGLKDDRFLFHLLIPGWIIRTNADSVAGDTLKWIFDLEDYLNDDYVINAESVIYSQTRLQKLVLVSILGVVILLFIIWKWRH